MEEEESKRNARDERKRRRMEISLERGELEARNRGGV